MKTTAEQRVEASWEVVVLLAGLVLAIVGARDHAGSWNDGSRLATVESLVDHHTWAIDDSVFVVVPPAMRWTPSPYPTENEGLMDGGTKDKLFIKGHFYSDKPPVQALLLAAEYRAWQILSGDTFRSRADRVCRLLTIGSSGLAYMLALLVPVPHGRRAGVALERTPSPDRQPGHRVGGLALCPRGQWS